MALKVIMLLSIFFICLDSWCILFFGDSKLRFMGFVWKADLRAFAQTATNNRSVFDEWSSKEKSLFVSSLCTIMCQPLAIHCLFCLVIKHFNICFDCVNLLYYFLLNSFRIIAECSINKHRMDLLFLIDWNIFDSWYKFVVIHIYETLLCYEFYWASNFPC